MGLGCRLGSRLTRFTLHYRRRAASGYCRVLYLACDRIDEWYDEATETFVRICFVGSGSCCQCLCIRNHPQSKREFFAICCVLVVVDGRSASFFKPTEYGEQHVQDRTLLWEEVCQKTLKPDQEQLLRLVNRLSCQSGEKFAEVNWVGWPAPRKRVQGQC